MQKSRVAVLLVLSVMMLGALAVPTSGAGGRSLAPPGPAIAGPSVPAAAALHPAPVLPTPRTTFPRTVLIETFTAEWCEFCPLETQALYSIEHSTNRSFVDVSELHLSDIYSSVDGIGQARANYYGAAAIPDVFFDGGHNINGMIGTLPVMENAYRDNLNNASMVPGNVSIAQTASVSSRTVSLQANITSGVTGTYQVISYLLEYIGKNDTSGPGGVHDVGNVVRRALENTSVALTAGVTTPVTGSGLIETGWVEQNLSIVTLVQDYSTKVIENANMLPLFTLTPAVVASPTGIPSGYSTMISVQVTNSSTHQEVAGAAVQMSSNAGGSFSPSSGVTGADGNFTTTFTAPKVSSTEDVLVTAMASQAGFATGSGTASITVSSLVPPSVPQGLGIAPGVSQVSLNWSAPATGSGGVTYHVYRATSAAGAFSEITTTTSTSYVDSGLAAGATYSYTVNAQSTGGFSSNTTSITASSVLVESQGLAANVGWWISVDSTVFRSATNASLSLFLPNGLYAYQIGSDAYEYSVATPTGSVTVAGAAANLQASFSLLYASLTGTVNVPGATVTLNGTALPVTDGGFTATRMMAGTYNLTVTASGYQPSYTQVTLTWGNTTTETVKLQANPTSGGQSSNGGLSGEDLGAIAVIAAVAVIAVGFAGLSMSRRKRGGKGSESGAKSSAPASPPKTP